MQTPSGGSPASPSPLSLTGPHPEASAGPALCHLCGGLPAGAHGYRGIQGCPPVCRGEGLQEMRNEATEGKERGASGSKGSLPSVSWATHRGNPQSSRGDKARDGGGHQFKVKNGGHRGGKATDAQTSRPQCSQLSSPWRAYEGDPWRQAGSGPAGGMGEGPIVEGTAGAMAQRPAREGWWSHSMLWGVAVVGASKGGITGTEHFGDTKYPLC